ncbi:MAG: 50S ribosomal protein L25 [Gemmataceae bacterium]
MEILTLPTQDRKDLGKRHSARLRKRGLIPAIIYGHKKDAVAVALEQDALNSAIRQHARLVELKLGSGNETALIKEVQHDHLGKAVLHVDFERVDRDEKVEVEVDVELKGTPPANGLLDQPLHVLTIECLAAEVPDSIKVNIGGMKVGDIIHVKDVTLPAGVRVLDEPDAIVIQVKAPIAETETPVAAGPAAEGATGTEPEIVGRRVKEDKPEE